MKLRTTIGAVITLMAMTLPAPAQSSISSASGAAHLGSYTAYIGDHDLYNSDGARLNQPWQVIRQDRANYHRFRIRDRADESDDFFSDASNRATMERMLRNGTIAGSAGRAIVRGGLLVQVDIYRSGGKDWIEITVLD
jgi:hypothetical protein